MAQKMAQKMAKMKERQGSVANMAPTQEVDKDEDSDNEDDEITNNTLAQRLKEIQKSQRTGLFLESTVQAGTSPLEGIIMVVASAL